MALRMKWTASVIAVLAFVNMTDGMWPFVKSSNETRPKAGQFKRLERQTESQQVRCNDAYYMLSYLNLTNPQYYSYPVEIDFLHRNIDGEYSEWARKMLVTAFNVAQNDNEVDVALLLCLYLDRIKMHVHVFSTDPFNEFLPVLQTAHYGMYKLLLCTMLENDCTMIDPATEGDVKFPAYVGDIIRSRQTNNDYKQKLNAVLKLLVKHWPDLVHNSSPGYCRKEASTSGTGPNVQPLTGKKFTNSILPLNDVFNNSMVNALLTDFGVFEDGGRLVGYLEEKNNEINNGSISFGQYVGSLVDYHEHVQRAFKTMMLRIYYDFLGKLQTFNKVDREEQVKLFLRLYNDWCDFWHSPKDENNGFYVKFLPDSWNGDEYYTTRTIPGIQLWVADKLKENDELSKVHLDNHTTASLSKINIDETCISTTVQEYKIRLGARFEASTSKPLLKREIQPVIFCAEALIASMKKLFADVDFRVTQALVKLGSSPDFQRFLEYEQQYDHNVFLSEDQTNSIQVCGTQTIEYTSD